MVVEVEFGCGGIDADGVCDGGGEGGVVVLVGVVDVAVHYLFVGFMIIRYHIMYVCRDIYIFFGWVYVCFVGCAREIIRGRYHWVLEGVFAFTWWYHLVILSEYW